VRIYVSLDNVTEEQLNFLGYYPIAENELFKVYLHKGEEIVVDKSDAFILVDDPNDAALLGKEIFQI